MKYTKAQQQDMLNSLSPENRKNLKFKVRSMSGSGIGDIINSVKNFLKPVMPFIEKVGPDVLKNYILPFLKKKMEGGALMPSGMGLVPSGGALKLAGQGKKLPHQIKGSQAAKDHMAKLRAMKKK